MSMPFYVPAEQMMKDKADFARKNIARGKALAALLYADGILICAENTSATLRKVSEIYDRIAFAGAGKYNEYDRLRIAGVRHADLKGYSYSREDVDAQSLANAYAQMLGDVFTHEIKPMEVEIVVAEVGDRPGRRPAVPHPLRRHRGRREGLHRAGGGEADAIAERVEQTYQPGRPLDEALRAAVRPGRRPPQLRPPSSRSRCCPGQRPPGLPPPERRGRGGHAGAARRRPGGAARPGPGRREATPRRGRRRDERG